MNYNNLIQRSKEDRLDGNQNNILYGDSAKQYQTKNGKDLVRISVEENLLVEYNEKSKYFAEKAQDEWRYDEILVVYMNFRNIYGTKAVLAQTLRTAMQLSRTKGAIQWATFHIFSERTDLHRSNIMNEFRKNHGLEKG